MYNELLAIAQVDVTVGISASIDNGGCSLNISITFQFNIFIFAGLPSGYDYEESQYRLRNRFDVDTFVENKTYELKKLFDDWQIYLKEHQTRVGRKVFGSMDELSDDLKTVCVEQIRIKQEIERIIKECYDHLKKTTSENAQTKLLKMMSNCYQLIRDLSVSFHIGGQILEMNVDISPEIVKIRENVLKEFNSHKDMKVYIERKKISEKIIDCKNRISDLNANVLEYEGAVNAMKGGQKYDTWLHEQKCSNMDIYEKNIIQWNQQEKDSLQKLLEVVKENIVNINNEIELLQSKKNIFNKKKTDNLINEYMILLTQRQERVNDLEQRLCGSKNTVTKEGFLSELEKDADRIKKKYQENQSIEKKLENEKKKLENAREELDKLVKKYEEVAKKIEAC